MVNRMTGVRSRAVALTIAMGAAMAGTVMSAAMSPAFADQTAFDKARQAADEQEMLDKARRERQIVNIGEASPVDKATQATKRQEELARLSEKLRQASANRIAKPLPHVDTPWTTEVVVAPPVIAPEQRSALGHRAQPPSAYDSRVTVLMVMTPGSKGIRRLDKSADPILCARDGCYISNGADTSSSFISLSRSMSPATTFGTRAGACNQQTGCVFRGVDISGPDAILQPVDLKVMVHDRRNTMSAFADMSCKVDAGRLSCGRPIVAPDYVLWVIPERIAEQAGSAILQRAIAEGLPAAQARADLPWLRN